jgi:hypothetical protein
MTIGYLALAAHALVFQANGFKAKRAEVIAGSQLVAVLCQKYRRSAQSKVKLS